MQIRKHSTVIILFQLLSGCRRLPCVSGKYEGIAISKLYQGKNSLYLLLFQVNFSDFLRKPVENMCHTCVFGDSRFRVKSSLSANPYLLILVLAVNSEMQI